MRRVLAFTRSSLREISILLLVFILLISVVSTSRSSTLIASDNPAAPSTQFGGLVANSEHNLISVSHPAGPLTPADYQRIYNEAQALRDVGVTFRTTQIQSIPEGQITVIEHVQQNYADFNDGALFKQFCPDHNNIDNNGYCLDFNGERDIEAIRNQLLEARGLYTALLLAEPASMMVIAANTEGQIVEQPARDVGREGVLETTREIANVHIIFGNEFLVDAVDYRFREGATSADLIILDELDQLADARQQFALALQVLVSAYNADLGWPRQVYVSDYFTEREFDVFGRVSGLYVQTIDEIASRHRQLGDDEAALAAYREGADEQYMQALSLAQKAAEQDADFLNNGGWEMISNINRLRSQAGLINDGVNAFGYEVDYVPLQSYAEMLNLTRNTFLVDATDDEANAQAAQREFDQNHDQVAGQLQSLRLNYDNRLIEICGSSNDDFLTCDGGLMAQNFYNIKSASDRIRLALQRLDNNEAQIQIEQDRAQRQIAITLEGGRELSLLAYATGVRSSYRVTSSKVSAQTNEFHIGAENRTTLTFSASLLPPKFGPSVQNSTSFYTGVSHSRTSTSSMSKVWDPAAVELGYLNGLRDVQQAVTQADIMFANSEATVRNLMLQQAELLIELDLAINEYNKLSSEHNHLVQQYHNWLNLRQIAQNNLLDSYLNNPIYRIVRETETVEASRSLGVAAHFAYLTAKALEYEFLAEVPFLADIFKARTADDIDNFLIQLEQLRASIGTPGGLNRVPYTISFAKDILGLTEENLNPTGELTPSEVINLRFERFQAFLQANNTDGRVEIPFSTLLLDSQMFSQNVWNNRMSAVGSPLPDSAGFSVNLQTRQFGGPPTPELTIVHGGHTTYRTIQDEIVQYSPRNAQLSGYATPAGFQSVETTANIFCSVNGNQQGIATNAFINRSVAASNWRMIIALDSPFNSPDPSDPTKNLDLAQIEDVVFLIDSTGYALPQRQAEAIADQQKFMLEFESAQKER